MSIESLFDKLSNNDFFSAGIGLMGAGITVSVFRRSSIYLDLWLKKYCLTTMEVPSKDKSYQWLLNWLSKRQMLANKHFMVETNFKELENGKLISEYSFPPATGSHFMIYKGFPLKIERNREKQMIDITRGGLPYETLTLTTIGRSHDIFKTILFESRELAINECDGKTITYVCNGLEWTPFGNPRKKRLVSSVVLEDGKAEKILNDVREFQASPEWYNQRGIPYRRGYLLYGPPGCGKTSFITALAGELFYNLCVLNLSERGLSDDKLNYLLNTAPPYSIIVLEDIESPLNNKGDDVYSVTRSGLLNALDGVACSEERIIFMTTNFYEKLDEALIRPGRVDLIVKIDYLDKNQAKRMFQKFYPHLPENKSEEFCLNIKSFDKLSPAMLQGHFLYFKKDAEGAIKNVGNIQNRVQSMS